MNILAIETSCDETSVAIVRDGREVLANIIASQIGLHQRFGGVVPELASRQHIVTLIPTLEEAMSHAGLDWDGIDAIAVTCGPGLAGALLVGLNAAKAIAFARNKPLIAVNHLEAHIYSNWIIPETLEREGPPPPREHPPAAEQTRAGAALRALGVEPPRRAGETDLPPGPPAGGRPQYTPPPPKQEAPRPDIDRVAPTDPAFPLLCLVVSGGHTELIYMSGHGQYSLLGKTVDDAAGEAFDKVARVLGLPYPGGPAIQRVAAFGDPDAIALPRTVLRGSADFSFSGLKTAVLRQAQNYGPPITPEEQAAEREAAERARREEEARIAAEERTRREAEERTRREEAARQEAEERERREAEARARWEAEEQARREAAEERRAAAATRRAEEERALQEEADRRAAEARTRRPEPAPPADDRPRRADTSERPSISILGGGRATPRPAPPESAPEAPPASAGPPAEAEPEPPGSKEAPAAPRKSRSSGLIRVTPESIRPEAGPPPGAVEHFDREAAPPITVRPERDTPRVLGKTEQEEVPPPAFLAERGGGTPPTPMRRRPATPGEPDVPAFLRGRPQPGEPAAPGAGKKSTPPSAPATPAKPASRATPPEPEERRPARPAPTAPAEPPAPPRAPRPASTPGPSTSPAARPPESRTPPAPPAATKPATPTPSDRTSTPAAPTPPRRAPLEREVRAIPKSVQAGRAPREGTDEDDVDQAIDDLLDEAPTERKKSSWLDADDEDEDLGTDDEPPPRPGRGSLGLDGPRPPEARVPVPPPDEEGADEDPDAATNKRGTRKPKPEKPRLPVADFAASFQAAAVEILVDKTVTAAAAYKVRTVLLAGGVAANTLLREHLRERLGPDITLRYPPPVLCTDNAAMVAAAAYFRYDAGLQHDWTLDIDPNARYVE